MRKLFKDSRCLTILSLGLLLAAAGCSDPDSEARLDEFLTNVDEAGGEPDASDTSDGISDGDTTPGGACNPSSDADIAGTYLMGVGAGLLEPNPINFELTVTDNGDDTFDFELQPLAKDACPDNADDCDGAEAREPVGSSITVSGIELDSNGVLAFATTDPITVAAPANTGPTGGSIVVSELNVELLACNDQFLCGGKDASTITLSASEPIPINNLDAYIGAVKTDDLSTGNFETAPRDCTEIEDFLE